MSKLKHLTITMLIIGAFGVAEIAILYIGFVTIDELQAREWVDLEIKHAPAPILSLSQHICKAGDGQYCDILVNLARCESSLNPDAMNVNTNGTVDMGLYQINSVHQDITNAQKLDVYASTRWTVDKIKQGQGHIWVCWSKL